MKKYTNKAVAAFYLAGLAAMVIVMLIIRFRLDRVLHGLTGPVV